VNRRRDYDALRVTAMLAVIYLHVAAAPLRQLDNAPLWGFSNLLASAASPAVPLFFMLSGALLLSQDKTADPATLKTRLPRLLVPLCAWTALILAYLALTDPAAARAALPKLLGTPVIVPYWFLYGLVPIYLLSPLLKKMTDGLSDSHWRYMMGLWVCLTLGLRTLRSLFPAWAVVFTEQVTLNINIVEGYLGYFLLGAWLERQKKVPSKALLSAAVLALTLLTAFGSWWDSQAQQTYSTRFTDYLTLPVMAMAACLFLLFRAAFRDRESKTLALFSDLSYPAYLLHPLVIGVGKLVWARLWAAPGPTTIPGQLLFYLAVTALTLLGSLVLSAIPGVCFLFTGRKEPLFRRKSAGTP